MHRNASSLRGFAQLPLAGLSLVTWRELQNGNSIFGGAGNTVRQEPDRALLRLWCRCCVVVSFLKCFTDPVERVAKRYDEPVLSGSPDLFAGFEECDA